MIFTLSGTESGAVGGIAQTTQIRPLGKTRDWYLDLAAGGDFSSSFTLASKPFSAGSLPPGKGSIYFPLNAINAIVHM